MSTRVILATSHASPCRYLLLPAASQVAVPAAIELVLGHPLGHATTARRMDDLRAPTGWTDAPVRRAESIRIHGPVDSVTADVTLCSRGCRPVSPMPATPGLRRGADQIAGQSLKRRHAQAERRKALRSAQDRRTRTGAGPGRLLRRWWRWRRRSRLGVSVRRPGQVPIRRGADVPGPAGPCSSQTNFAGTPEGRPGGSWSRI